MVVSWALVRGAGLCRRRPGPMAGAPLALLRAVFCFSCLGAPSRARGPARQALGAALRLLSPVLSFPSLCSLLLSARLCLGASSSSWCCRLALLAALCVSPPAGLRPPALSSFFSLCGLLALPPFPSLPLLGALAVLPPSLLSVLRCRSSLPACCAACAPALRCTFRQPRNFLSSCQRLLFCLPFFPPPTCSAASARAAASPWTPRRPRLAPRIPQAARRILLLWRLIHLMMVRLLQLLVLMRCGCRPCVRLSRPLRPSLPCRLPLFVSVWQISIRLWPCFPRRGVRLWRWPLCRRRPLARTRLHLPSRLIASRFISPPPGPASVKGSGGGVPVCGALALLTAFSCSWLRWRRTHFSTLAWSVSSLAFPSVLRLCVVSCAPCRYALLLRRLFACLVSRARLGDTASRARLRVLATQLCHRRLPSMVGACLHWHRVCTAPSRLCFSPLHPLCLKLVVVLLLWRLVVAQVTCLFPADAFIHFVSLSIQC